MVLCSDNPPLDPRLLSRLSEQTRLVEKLTEQNAKKERTISSLKMDVQKLVRGAGRGRCGAGVRLPAPLRHLPRPQERLRGGGQLAAGALEDEVEALRRVLKSIAEVLGPPRSFPRGGRG